MTDDELAAIHEWLHSGTQYTAVAPAIVKELVDEVERLAVENAKLREVAQALATTNLRMVWAYDEQTTIAGCPFPVCKARANEMHADDCPVTKARALLGNEGTQS